MAILTATKPQRWILGEKFQYRSGHHESIKALWESKWKFPVNADIPLKIK